MSWDQNKEIKIIFFDLLNKLKLNKEQKEKIAGELLVASIYRTVINLSDSLGAEEREQLVEKESPDQMLNFLLQKLPEEKVQKEFKKSFMQIFDSYIEDLSE
jgi:hypothetical protein